MATPTNVPWGWFYAGFNEANTKIYHPPYGGAKINHPQFLGVPNHRLIILGVVNNIFAQKSITVQVVFGLPLSIAQQVVLVTTRPGHDANVVQMLIATPKKGQLFHCKHNNY